MSENEVLERVKSAIAEKFAPAIDCRAPYAKVMIDMAARAAIAAMREPTQEMLDAGYRAQVDAALGGTPMLDGIYRAMVDEVSGCVRPATSR